MCYAHADGAGRDDDVHRYIRKRRKLERETENARYEQMNRRDYEFTIRGLKLLRWTKAADASYR